MGQVFETLVAKTVPRPEFNNRGVVELCENIHLHWRNFRLEFTKDEFRLFLAMMQAIDPQDIVEANLDPEAFTELVRTDDIPDESEWDDRLAVEKQVQGHYHFHYRQLRIEVNNLDEIGIKP